MQSVKLVPNLDKSSNKMTNHTKLIKLETTHGTNETSTLIIRTTGIVNLITMMKKSRNSLKFSLNLLPKILIKVLKKKISKSKMSKCWKQLIYLKVVVYNQILKQMRQSHLFHRQKMTKPNR